MVETKRNTVIDYVKYFCALEVIWMHTVNVCDSLTGILAIVNFIVMKIANILPPVELFFVFSAYFLFSKKPDFHRVLKWERKLYVTYLMYSVLYIQQITEHFAGRHFLLNIVSIIRQFFFTGYGIMGWFIPALAWGGIVVYLLFKLNECLGHRWVSHSVIFVLIIMSMLGSTYYHVLPVNPISVFYKLFEGIGILRGIIFTYIGYELSNKELNSKIGKKEVFSAIALWCIMTTLIYYTQSRGLGLNTRGMLTKYMYVYFLSIILLKLKNYEVCLQAGPTDLGRMSVIIYYIHAFFINIINCIENPFLLWLVIMIVTSVIAKVIVCGDKQGIRFCKYLI